MRPGVTAGLWSWLRRYLRPEFPALLGALSLSLCIAALGAAQPLLTRMAVDRGLLDMRFGILLAACGGLFNPPSNTVPECIAAVAQEQPVTIRFSASNPPAS